MPEPSIRRAGAIVLGLTICAKLTGFVREAVVANTFGTSRTVDVYLAAVIVPAIVTNVVFQALPNAFIPLFTRHEIASSVRRLAIILIAASLGIAAVVWLLAPWAASLTNSGFSMALKRETISLVRIGALAILLATVEALGRSRLIARKRFAQSGFSSLWSSMTIIAAVVFFADAGSHALMWGFVTGTGAMAVWNLLPLQRKPRDVAVSSLEENNFANSWIFVVLTVSTAGMLYGLIDRHLGSYLPVGSLAALQYADLVASQPVGLLGITLAGAIFPYLASGIQSGNHTEAASILDRAIRWCLFAIIPAGLLLIFFGTPIVRILFERGEFNAVSRQMTGSVLSVYGVWMIPTVLAAIIAKVHYSMRNTRPLLAATGAALAAKLVFSFWLVNVIGIAGLAAASCVSSTTYLVILTIGLPTWGKTSIRTGWVSATGVLVAMTLVGCGAAWALARIPSYPSGKLGAIITLSIAGAVTTGLIMGLGARFGVTEATRLRQMIKSRLPSRVRA